LQGRRPSSYVNPSLLPDGPTHIKPLVACVVFAGLWSGLLAMLTLVMHPRSDLDRVRALSRGVGAAARGRVSIV
jgi:hypothetical protein